MCGRASLTASPEEIAEEFGVTVSLTPRFNIAPSEPMLVVRTDARGAREAALLRWGLVRPGSQDARAPINLRLESAARGAMKSTLRARRCVVPLTGFYEWQRQGKNRQPFNVRRKDGRVFGVAGVWERLESGDLPPLDSCLVLTTEANEIVEPIHDRMPVILDPAAYERWLDPAPVEPRQLASLLCQLRAEELERYTVSSLVNRAGVEDARCLEPARPLGLW